MYIGSPNNAIYFSGNFRSTKNSNKPKLALRQRKLVREVEMQRESGKGSATRTTFFDEVQTRQLSSKRDQTPLFCFREDSLSPRRLCVRFETDFRRSFHGIRTWWLSDRVHIFPGGLRLAAISRQLVASDSFTTKCCLNHIITRIPFLS